jgi:predicted nuclease of predicted toxin-antitoxin system
MMRFLVDAQLPPALARFLEAHGHVSCLLYRNLTRPTGDNDSENKWF